MSDPEGFLSRWARLKREADETPQTSQDDASTKPSPDTPRGASSADSVAPSGTAPADELGVDLSALPSIDSITAATDIRGFLAPGVPAELARAALRRAWVVDPKIRDFIGIAENQWDFTAPDSIPGFGPLGPLDDVRRMLARVMGDGGEEPERPAASEVIASAANTADLAAGGETTPSGSAESCATRGETAAVAAESSAPLALPVDDVQCGEVTSAAHKDELDDVASGAPTRRTHGGALPK
jgi:hypothetical protein